jgi:hypothetical protein
LIFFAAICCWIAVLPTLAAANASIRQRVLMDKKQAAKITSTPPDNDNSISNPKPTRVFDPVIDLPPIIWSQPSIRVFHIYILYFLSVIHMVTLTCEDDSTIIIMTNPDLLNGVNNSCEVVDETKNSSTTGGVQMLSINTDNI